MIQSPYAGHGAMLVFSALVAGSFSLGSVAANEIDPLVLTALRFAIAAVMMTAVARILYRPRREWFSAPWRFAALGACMALYFYLMFVGLRTEPPVAMSAVFTLAPAFSACFGYLLLRQATTPWIGLALAVGACGALWVIFDGSPAALMRIEIGYGLAIFVIGTASHALYTPLIPFLKRGEPTVVLAAGMLVTGGTILLVMAAPRLAGAGLGDLPGRIWAIIAYLSIGTTAISFFLVQFAAQRLPASKVMAYTYLIPSWVIVWELARGNPGPQSAVLWGVALSVLALVMLLRR